MTRSSRTWLLAERPVGLPDADDFELVDRDVGDPDPGAVLVRTVYLSVDPYMRDRMSERESYADHWDVGDPLRGGVVGEVVAEQDTAFDPGDLVTGRLPWAEFATAPAHTLDRVDPDRGPLSAHLGVLGMTGRTAYFGTREVADPGPGETFLVSGAAGAVGSVAGQIAGLAGARVVGVAGSDEKVRILEAELGFDRAVNYAATDDLRGAVAEAAPDGVDAYFDNVGGPVTDAAFTQLNRDARVAVCGQISQYNATERPTGPRKLSRVLTTRATVQGFLVSDFEPRFDVATERLAAWLERGAVAHRETVRQGIEVAPDAFLGLFGGENVGKQLVQVGPEP